MFHVLLLLTRRHVGCHPRNGEYDAPEYDFFSLSAVDWTDHEHRVKESKKENSVYYSAFIIFCKII